MLLCHPLLSPTIIYPWLWEIIGYIVNRLFILLVSTILVGCSNFDFSSNVDRDNFEKYFRPSQVTVFDKQELQGQDYQVLGSVQGSSCQEQENDLPADAKEARTKARINAYELNANGIIFQSCINFPRDETCVSNVICYGQAIKVFADTNE